VFNQLQVGEYLQWCVEASYVELYNESYRDLTEPSMASSDISIFEQQYAHTPCTPALMGPRCHVHNLFVRQGLIVSLREAQYSQL